MWPKNVLKVVVLLITVADSNGAEWVSCPDKVDGKLSSILSMLNESMVIKNVDPCSKIEVYGIPSLKAGKGCASKEDEDAIEQKFEFNLANLTAVCHVKGISAVTQMFKINATFLPDSIIGAGTIHAEWLNCQLHARLTIDLKAEEVIFREGGVNSASNALKIWAGGRTLFTAAVGAITRLPKFPELMAFIVKPLFGKEVAYYAKTNRDMLSNMGCEE